MKFVMVVLSGVADLPTSVLGDKTPLSAAKKPALDALAASGRLGAIAPSRAATGSDVALLELFGYDPVRFPLRRGPLEAIGRGIEFGDDDLVIRGNLVSLYNEMIHDLTAGRIRDPEAEILLSEVAIAVDDESLTFHPGRGYRFLVVVKGGAGLRATFTPPHVALGRPVRELYPQGPDALRLERVLDRSRSVLTDHPINKVRIDLGENPANFVWLWGAGARASLPSFESVYGLRGVTIGGAPLARGFSEALAMHTPFVPGATGDLETDLAAKALAALAAIADESKDFVFVHVQAANEASHLRDPKLKMSVIQDIDRLLMQPLADSLAQLPSWRLLVATDHLTATGSDVAASGKAPLLLAGSDIAAVRSLPFDEGHAATADLQITEPATLMEYFLGIHPRF
jgi:2,3-bisphosphoglycerate-independent phosphoglycerate mutase